ncbi:hypothetical protein DFH11DRAFT_1548669 [Phellopilus nigrolimitatus]|nr:hypothetical protein DFH11DRAFT_1548669 [Phellopilus nigrolimitatus]
MTLHEPPKTQTGHRGRRRRRKLAEAVRDAAWTVDGVYGSSRPPMTLRGLPGTLRGPPMTADVSQESLKTLHELQKTWIEVAVNLPSALHKSQGSPKTEGVSGRVKEGLGTVKEAAGAESTVKRRLINSRSIEKALGMAAASNWTLARPSYLHQRIDIDLILKDVRVLFDDMLRCRSLHLFLLSRVRDALDDPSLGSTVFVIPIACMASVFGMASSSGSASVDEGAPVPGLIIALLSGKSSFLFQRRLQARLRRQTTGVWTLGDHGAWSSGDDSISSGVGAGAYDQDDVEIRNATTENGLRLQPRSHSAREVLPMTIHPAQVSTSATAPALTMKTDRACSRANGPPATASSIE